MVEPFDAALDRMSKNFEPEPEFCLITSRRRDQLKCPRLALSRASRTMK